MQKQFFGLVDKSHGTGFFMAKEYVVTAAHIAKNAKYVQMRDGSRLPCTLWKTGRFEELDWAVLHVPGANGKPLAVAKQTDDGEPVWCYGDFGCAGGSLEVTVGKITGCGDFGLRYCSAPVYPGYSGGPVVGRNSRVLGLTSRQSVSDGTDRCIYVPIQSVKKAAGL